MVITWITIGDRKRDSRSKPVIVALTAWGDRWAPPRVYGRTMQTANATFVTFWFGHQWEILTPHLPDLPLMASLRIERAVACGRQNHEETLMSKLAYALLGAGAAGGRCCLARLSSRRGGRRCRQQ